MDLTQKNTRSNRVSKPIEELSWPVQIRKQEKNLCNKQDQNNPVWLSYLMPQSYTKLSLLKPVTKNEKIKESCIHNGR